VPTRPTRAPRGRENWALQVWTPFSKGRNRKELPASAIPSFLLRRTAGTLLLLAGQACGTQLAVIRLAEHSKINICQRGIGGAKRLEFADQNRRRCPSGIGWRGEIWSGGRMFRAAMSSRKGRDVWRSLTACNRRNPLGQPAFRILSVNIGDVLKQSDPRNSASRSDNRRRHIPRRM